MPCHWFRILNAKKWTQADDKYLFERHKEKFVKDIAETLGFSVPAVESRLKQLNLTGLYDEKQWTQKEDLLLHFDVSPEIHFHPTLTVSLTNAKII